MAMFFSATAMNSVSAETMDGTDNTQTIDSSVEQPAQVQEQPAESVAKDKVEKNKTITKAALPGRVKAKSKKTYIVVSWSKVKSSKGYYLYRSTKKKGKYKKIKTFKSWKSRKYKDQKIKPGKRYYYKVIPRNKTVNTARITASVKIASPKIASAKLKIKKSFKVKAYAYSGGGKTKMGNRCKVGRIAVDPRVIKLGSWLYIEGYGYAQACDTGGNIKGKTIDVYKNTSGQASRWGVKHPKVYVLK